MWDEMVWGERVRDEVRWYMAGREGGGGVV
jgi:hypothetical protein